MGITARVSWVRGQNVFKLRINEASSRNLNGEADESEENCEEADIYAEIRT